MNYNPYFPGGAISMARVLYDGLVEYDDSTYHPACIDGIAILIIPL